MAIRCSRVFTGEQFGEGPATILLDQEKIVGVETGHIQLNESWQVAEYPTATVLPVAHGNLHRGVSQLEDAGFSPREAVAAATSEAARVCGLRHRKGLLPKGYDADLIVVDGDLQTDLTACNGCAWSCSLGNRSANGCRLHLVTARVARPALGQCNVTTRTGAELAIPPERRTNGDTIIMLIELACT